VAKPLAKVSKKLLLRGLSVVMAFSAGALAHSLFSRSRFTAAVAENQDTPAYVADPPPQVPAAMTLRAGKATAHVEDDSARGLRLQPEVVDALLTGGRLDRKLGLMGLTAEQVANVTRIQDEATATLKRIEKEHASVVSDDRGDFVVISPFPQEKRAWLNQIEEKLRELVGDDRASVISRMIAFSDNDEAVGSGRREIFINEPPAPGQKLRIEERTFNDAGEHIDTDYELVTERSQGRWGHVLDFKQQ
jgi:hypothetical protein